MAEKNAPETSGQISYEAFLKWADEDAHAEWVDGELVIINPASRKHQHLSDFNLSDELFCRSPRFRRCSRRTLSDENEDLPGPEVDMKVMC